MKHFLSVLFTPILAALCLGTSVTAAHASGTVILEGSDAIGYHCAIGEAGGCTYMNQTWTALGGSSSLPIAVVGTNDTDTPTTSSTHAIEDFTSLSTAGSLNQYAAIYFLAGNGCCNSDPADMAGRGSDVSAYVNSGGTVEIENYDGNSNWDFLTGGTNNSSYVAGYGVTLPGPSCTDGETVTATGLANGFTQPPAISCWTHQAYSEPHFAALGFTESFYDADPAFAADNPGFGAFSSLLSNGDTITGGGGFASAAPEPSTWALMLIAIAVLGGMLRFNGSLRHKRVGMNLNSAF